MNRDTSSAPAHAADPSPATVLAAVRQGVAMVAFATESSHGARVDAKLLDIGRKLRRAGVPCVLFEVHLHPTDDGESRRRTDALFDRIRAAGHRWVVCLEVWTAPFGERLMAAGLEIIECHRSSFEGAVFAADPASILVPQAVVGPPLDEYAGLVELVGLQATEAVENVDLSIGDPCSYQASIATNPFFAELADDPRFSNHRGCSYCFSAHRPPRDDSEGQLTRSERLLREVRTQRAMFPALKTLWMLFAEVFYDDLGATFAASEGDAVWRGLTMAMQCRPDVLAKRWPDIERLAEGARRAGTVIRIAVTGFENFSPAEIERLNRGVTPSDLASAAEILARWRREPIPGLDVGGLVPSFILFTPWTTLDDLELNLREIDRHGLTNANVERMRLGAQTPLHEMARRAGLTEPGPVRLAVHPNGYLSETAYRFVDVRVAAVNAGFEALKGLAFTDQVPLLAAVVAAVKRDPEPAKIEWSGIANAWESVRAAATAAGGARAALERGAGQPSLDVVKTLAFLRDGGHAPKLDASRPALRLPRRASSLDGDRDNDRIELGVGSGCNNGCEPCVWARRLDFRPSLERVDEARVRGKVVRLAGREPTVRTDLPERVAALRVLGATRVDLETNGRRFVYASYVRALATAGVDAVSVKLFGADAGSWDRHTRVPGSFAQTIEGMATLVHDVPSIQLTGVIHPGKEPGTNLGALFELGRSLGLTRLHVVLRLARQDLLELDALASTLGALLAREDGPALICSVE